MPLSTLFGTTFGMLFSEAKIEERRFVVRSADEGSNKRNVVTLLYACSGHIEDQ